MALVEPAQVRTWLGLDEAPFDTARAELAIRVAGGWLRGATGPAAWPDPPSEQLWSGYLELAGLAYDNPTSMAQRNTGAELDGYMVTRRAEILASVAASLSAGGTPVGSFPLPQAWP